MVLVALHLNIIFFLEAFLLIRLPSVKSLISVVFGIYSIIAVYRVFIYTPLAGVSTAAVSPYHDYSYAYIYLLLVVGYIKVDVGE